MSYVLGLNAFHGDSSACLLENGHLVAAAEEERFQRKKHWAGFPTLAIRYCLSEADIDLTMIDCVAINSDPKAAFWRKLAYLTSSVPSPGLIKEKLKTRKKRNTIQYFIEKDLSDLGHFTGAVYRIEHHLAHLVSCFNVSPYPEAVAVSVDGFGDFSSGAWGYGSGSTIRIGGRIYFPHSLGVFYQAMTQFLGFPHYGDEYKVMGLAPYGKPRYQDEMQKIVNIKTDGSYRLNLTYFKHHNSPIGYEWDNEQPKVSTLYSERLYSILGPGRGENDPIEDRHLDIARSVQAMYEKAFLNLLEVLYKKYRSKNLVLSGGCAMNSVANGKIRETTGFRNIYIQPAAGDAGGALGAAFRAYALMGDEERRFVMTHPYWGPSYNNQVLLTIVQGKSEDFEREKCSVNVIQENAELNRKTVAALVSGKVVGWFQGRMEWGPRALGNRSILGDPRRADMKDILNTKIKRRESFRPFAPSILREFTKEWFETDDDVPFMMKVYQVREERRTQIPAVTHVDGSGRLQTVTEQGNKLYYDLISEFNRNTGVPILLNTSFNENEPVVCRPEEAIECFLRTKMDVLVLGNIVIERP